MAVTFNVDSAGNFNSGVTNIIDSLFTLNSGTNRAMVVILSLSNQSASTTTVQWPNLGQSLTQIGAANSAAATMRVELWGLIAPNNQTNSAVEAKFTNPTDVVISTVVFNGVDQSSFANAFKNFNSATFTNAAAQVAVTSKSGDIVTGGLCINLSAITSVSGTQIFLTNGPATISGASNYDNGAASVTLSSQPNNTGVYAGVDVSALSTGVPYQPYFQQFLASKRKSTGWTPLSDPRWRKWRRERGILRKAA